MKRARRPVAEAEATVHDLAHDGRGVARDASGKVVFISGALPGEGVRYRLTRRGRDIDEGEALEIAAPSAQRVQPGCPHFGLCGGCALQHLSAAQQILFKQKQVLDAFVRIGKLQPDEIAPPLSGPVWGYRRRARLAVKHVPAKGRVLVGFREREAPLIAALEACAVLDARVGQRLNALAELIDSLSIRDRIPQIEVAAAAHVALVFRVLSEPSDADREMLRQFAAREHFEIFLQSGGLDSIVPLSPLVRQLSFSPDGSDLRLEFQPTDFIQVNDEVNRQMVRQAIAWLAPAPGDAVLELFAGLGNFSLPLAAAGAEVTAVEGDAGLVARGQDNAKRNGLHIRFLAADLFATDPNVSWLQQDYAAVLLDPPRAGAREILPVVAARRPARIVYISCHPATLARDAAVLVHEYGYRLRRAGVMDMFPHTAHVESMALFERT